MDPLGEALNGAGLLEVGHQDADKGVEQHHPGEAGVAQVLLQQGGEPQQQGLHNGGAGGHAHQSGAGEAGDGILGCKGQHNGQDGRNDGDNAHVDQIFHCITSLSLLV